jgi:DNA-binding XRE family transcriptional regulator
MPAKTILLSEVVAKSLSDPAVKKEYEALAEEFQIAQLIINMRKAARLTQQELADRTGIKQPQLANLAKEAGYTVEIHLIPQSQSEENTEILTPLSIAVTASI